MTEPEKHPGVALPPLMSCPQPKLLEQLLLGELPPSIADVLAAHLEHCDRCAALASESHADSPLIHAAREISTTWQKEDETFVEELIEKTTAIINDATVKELRK